MKKLLLISSLVFISASTSHAQDFYQQKQNEVEFKRINQALFQAKKQSEQQSVYVRSLEKENDSLKKDVAALNKRMDDLLDLWANFENISLPNLVASDNTLSDRINDTNSHITEQTTLWNWGELSRSCKAVGKHQQVRTILTEDGSASIRYLCFDGKVIHLNTTSNIPPVE